jgi:hypothetical protein
MFCEPEREVPERKVKDRRVPVGQGRNSLCEQRPAIVAAPDRRHTAKNRILLVPAQPPLLNQNGIDEALFGLDGARQNTLRPKQARQNSIHGNQLRI